jgi:hypothetical protein
MILLSLPLAVVFSLYGQTTHLIVPIGVSIQLLWIPICLSSPTPHLVLLLYGVPPLYNCSSAPLSLYLSFLAFNPSFFITFLALLFHLLALSPSTLRASRFPIPDYNFLPEIPPRSAPSPLLWW